MTGREKFFGQKFGSKMPHHCLTDFNFLVKQIMQNLYAIHKTF